jgi:hypothetical protein
MRFFRTLTRGEFAATYSVLELERRRPPASLRFRDQIFFRRWRRWRRFSPPLAPLALLFAAGAAFRRWRCFSPLALLTVRR